MAMRGRGRGGWRGGRSGGAGRIPAKDENGVPLDLSTSSGPAPLYPKLDLPEHPALGPRDQVLMLSYDRIHEACIKSAYHVERPRPPGDRLQDDIERYQDRYKKRQRRERPPVAALVTLDPRTIPTELWTKADKRVHAAAREQGGQYAQQGGASLLGRLELYAQREKDGGTRGGDEAGGQEGDGEEGEQLGPLDDDLEEEMEDDDYYQAEHFDDDDGYDDDVGGDADEGAIY